MQREKSFRVFVLYALVLQFMLIASLNSKVEISSITSIQDYNPRNSVVQVLVSYESTMEPESSGPAYTGTGTSIAVKNNTVYVLTARHVCLPMPPEMSYITGLKQKTEIQNITGEYHTAKIVAISERDDLCVISYEAQDATAMATTKIAKLPPFLDERVSMYAAPAGFYTPSAVAQFTGIHSGNVIMMDGISSVYTIPATGGSSGASILNHDGNIVGVLHSTLSEFHHVALASTHEALVEFIEFVELNEAISVLD